MFTFGTLIFVMQGLWVPMQGMRTRIRLHLKQQSFIEKVAA